MTTPCSLRRTAEGTLPNFLLIGAMRAGTTSLYRSLRSHPQVFMPASKAPEFFAGEPNSRRGIEWYRRQFGQAGPDALAIGEASSAYTRFPRYSGVPKRIAQEIPDVRLVYVVRDPIERIGSHYQAMVRAGSETRPFEDALCENPIYLCYSRYALQIEQYLEHFSREQLLVVTSEDLRAQRGSVLRRVHEFLAVDPDVDRKLRIRNGLEQRLPQRKFTVPEETRKQLALLLADDVRRLRGFIGPDFDGWGIA